MYVDKFLFDKVLWEDKSFVKIVLLILVLKRGNFFLIVLGSGRLFLFFLVFFIVVWII